MTNEAYIDGRWIWVDSQRGWVFDYRGHPAGAWDLKCRPSIVRNATDEQIVGTRRPSAVDLKKEREILNGCFHPRAVLAVTNYLARDWHLYNYDWEPRKKAVEARVPDIPRRMKQRLGLGRPGSRRNGT
jgi:hypothetical protein